MNQCILMAEVMQAPQTRYTQDGQTPIAEMIVQFAGIRPDDPPSRLRVIGWGNMAQLVQEGCKVGDRLILEGRLRMNMVERDSFKEKVAELTLNRFHSITGGEFVTSGGIASGTTNTPAPRPTAAPETPPPAARRVEATTVSPSQTYRAPAEPDYDEIPF